MQNREENFAEQSKKIDQNIAHQDGRHQWLRPLDHHDHDHQRQHQHPNSISRHDHDHQQQHQHPNSISRQNQAVYQQYLMTQQAYYNYLWQHHQQLLLNHLWQQQQPHRSCANRPDVDYSRLTSFLCRGNSFLTPWSWDPNAHDEDDDGDLGTGEKRMFFQPGSFFTYGIPYVKPEEGSMLSSSNHVEDRDSKKPLGDEKEDTFGN